nr:putative reverse transcriptase, RNA-dependent DNA polymerase [Tanacetum cinerariifolium]
MVAAAKLPVLNPNEFELWKMRIKQYFLMTDYALWEVILNGDSPPLTRSIDGVETPYPPTTIKEKLVRKNELKARGEGLKVADGNVDYKSQKIPTENRKESRRGHFAKKYKASKHQDNMNREAPRRTVPLWLILLEDLQVLQTQILRLLDSQQCDKSKTGLGYDSQRFDSQVLQNQLNDKYNTSEGYHAVPPPYIGNFIPLKPDLVFVDEHVVSKSVTSLPGIAKSEVNTSETTLKNVSAPIIEDWVSDNEDEDEIETKSKQIKPSFAKVKFVKPTEHVKSSRKSVKQEESNRQTKYPRKNSQSPRGNQRNWNNLMTQRLGDNLEFKNKACYECGSFNHLIKNYDSYKKKKMVEKLVWNNARRVNHQNSQRLSHPHSKRNFVPKAVLTNSALKTLNTARQTSSRAAVSVNTVRPINSAYPRSTVNGAKPCSNIFHKSHSPVRRTFNQKTTPKNSDLKEKVYTTKVNNVTTAGTKAVVSTVQRNEENAVKSSASWIWRPTGNVINHISKDSGSYMLKRFNYVDLQGRSKHMTGNKSFLIDYKEIDGGFFAFGGSPKGGIEKHDNAVQTVQEKASDHEYILLSFMPSNNLTLSSSTQSSDDKNVDEVPGKGDEGVSKGSGIDDQERTDSCTQNVNTAGPSINTSNTNINTGCLNINNVGSNDPSMPSLEETRIFDDVYDDIEVGAEADTNNLALSIVIFKSKEYERGIVVRNKARLVAQGYTQEEGIDYDEVFTPVARIEAIELFFAYASFIGFIVYQMDVKSVFLYAIIEEEVYMCQPPGFEDPYFPYKVYKVEKALYDLHQAPRAWYEILSTYLLENGFRRCTIDKTLFIKKDREYVAAATCCGQVLWVQNQMLDYGLNLMNTKIYIDNESIICIVKNPVVHSKTKHIEIRHHFIIDSYEKKLIQVIKIHTDHNVADLLTKAFDMAFMMTLEFILVVEQRLVLNGCLDWIAIAVKYEIQVSVVGLTYYWLSKAVWMNLKKKKSKRKPRKETEVPQIEPQNEESISKPSNDPLPSGKDRMKLTELMNFCTNLPKQVLDLEKAKTAQAKKIADLKKRVKKLERKKKSRTLGFKRLYKGRIAEIDADEDLSLINETAQDQGRMNEEDLFRVHDLDGDEVIMDVTACENIEHDATVAKKEVSTDDDQVVTTAEDVKVVVAATTPQISKDELTLAQTLMEIKAAKPKTKEVIIQELSEFRTTSQLSEFRTTSSLQPSQLPQAKDKEVTRQLEAQMKAEMEEEERVAREKDEAKIDVIEEWDDVQATIDVDKQDSGGKVKENSNELTEGSSKRARDEIEQESAKRQMLEKEDDTTELKRCLEIVPEDDDEVTIKETPQSSKSPTIVDYKIYKEWKKSYFKIIRADENSQNYLTFEKMFKNFNREDLEVLRNVVKETFKKTKPMDDMDNLLFQTLRTMFEHHV